MARAVLLAALLVAAALNCAAQEPLPSTTDGPLAIPSAARTAAVHTPQPDKDGVYLPVSGIETPIFLERQSMVWPADCSQADQPGSLWLVAVIDASGQLRDPRVLDSRNPACDRAALDLLQHSRFGPGSYKNSPVPVRIWIRIPFGPAGVELYPRIVRHPHVAGEVFARNPSSSNFPIVIHQVDPEFPDEARQAKYQGVVIVSLTVNEQGLPENIQIVRPVGMGLDEKAIEAAQQYRFKPAMMDGHPVSKRINIEINFRLY